jgi:hypothetical protein
MIIQSNCLQTAQGGGGHGGFGIFCAGKWAQAWWPQNWFTEGITRDMTVLELFPVQVAVMLWKEYFTNIKILYHIDNMAVVHVINNRTSKSDSVMNLVNVRKFVLTCLEFNILIHAKYIPSKSNVIADHLSRSQWGKFRLVAPEADQWPTPLPTSIWEI